MAVHEFNNYKSNKDINKKVSSVCIYGNVDKKDINKGFILGKSVRYSLRSCCKAVWNSALDAKFFWIIR